MLQPSLGNVAIKLDEAPDTFAGGLFVPETARDKQDTAVVVAISRGVETKNGGVVPHGIDVGDRILLAVKYAGAEVQHEGETLIIVPVSQIAAVLA